jgi:hypothetical protein
MRQSYFQVRSSGNVLLPAMAKAYRPYIPEQDLLLPPSLREWLPEDPAGAWSKTWRSVIRLAARAIQARLRAPEQLSIQLATTHR